MMRKIEIQRLTIVSSKAFEAVVATVEKAIGRPDMLEFGKASAGADTLAELEILVNRSVSELGLMLFMKLDIGAVLRKESGLARPKAHRFIIGNPLIMKEMVKEVLEAGSYAPITLWSTSDKTACISATTRWKASLRLMGASRRWMWRAISMKRSRSSCVMLQGKL